ncbi:FAD-binding oxidoreductase [Malikia sp.]|uniref:FAD-binding oxidoreductase n=1 Tax=Malikia sp. TaxID=2070706 RepID=UPI0026050B72|nr:FAD-binding oxidoreductase [Malikia sp.]MDD2727789.1 FAD-binding oxidoreductase [Malikia sp.]
MFSIETTAGTYFKSAAKDSLLAAAEKSGNPLSYSCRTGRCSTCKCKIISGSSVALSEELGLTEAEKSEGWILSCVRSATSDMVLEVEDLGGVNLPVAKTAPCRIQELNRLANDVMQVRLRLPPTADFTYLPGQYIDVIGPAGIRRSYSLANARAADKHLELHIRSVPGGTMSEYWFQQAKVNDLLRLNGPLGTFFLRQVSGLDLVFLATGTGIAPVKSMLEGMSALSADQQPRSVTVYWGGRKPQDLYYDVAAFSGSARYVPVLSQADDTWYGARGHVQQQLLNDMSDLSQVVVYACGSDAMIHSAKTLLNSAGLPTHRFHSDAFVCSASV